jgi:hypothetical protein
LRFLLDAHVSDRRIGEELRRRGHDVRSAAADAALERLDDDALLGVAAVEGRILVTFDTADFPRLLREWAEAGRSHAGAILVHGLQHSDFGPLLRGIDRLLGLYPEPDAWTDVAVVVSPEAPS